MTLGLAAGLAVAAVVVLRVNDRQTQALASVPMEDLEFLEQAPLLEHLDVLLDAEELDHA